MLESLGAGTRRFKLQLKLTLASANRCPLHQKSPLLAPMINLLWLKPTLNMAVRVRADPLPSAHLRFLSCNSTATFIREYILNRHFVRSPSFTSLVILTTTYHDLTLAAFRTHPLRSSFLNETIRLSSHIGTSRNKHTQSSSYTQVVRSSLKRTNHPRDFGQSFDRTRHKRYVFNVSDINTWLRTQAQEAGY